MCCLEHMLVQVGVVMRDVFLVSVLDYKLHLRYVGVALFVVHVLKLLSTRFGLDFLYNESCVALANLRQSNIKIQTSPNLVMLIGSAYLLIVSLDRYTLIKTTTHFALLKTHMQIVCRHS